MGTALYASKVIQILYTVTSNQLLCWIDLISLNMLWIFKTCSEYSKDALNIQKMLWIFILFFLTYQWLSPYLLKKFIDSNQWQCLTKFLKFITNCLLQNNCTAISDITSHINDLIIFEWASWVNMSIILPSGYYPLTLVSPHVHCTVYYQTLKSILPWKVGITILSKQHITFWNWHYLSKWVIFIKVIPLELQIWPFQATEQLLSIS